MNSALRDTKMVPSSRHIGSSKTCCFLHFIKNYFWQRKKRLGSCECNNYEITSLDSPMTSMPSFTMSGASQQNQHTTSSMSSLSTGGGMSPMGMTVGMTVGPSPGACLQQRDNGYSCGVARPPSYEPLHLGYGARPTCSPTQPYHAASLNQYNQNASSTGECLPHSLHSLLAL